jgi:AcrR family transcriptional regulator
MPRDHFLSMVGSQLKGQSQESHGQQSQDSRDEILKAATQLFANRGFHETSMSEVAREARVSKALIFWHFKTKEELFLAVLNRLLEPYFIDFAEESRMLDERHQILRLVEFYLLFVRDHANSVRFFLAQMLREQRLSEGLGEQIIRLYGGYREMLVELISRAQHRGLCASGFTPEDAAGFILSALNGLMIEFLFMPGATMHPESAVSMVDQWLFGASEREATGAVKAEH